MRSTHFHPDHRPRGFTLTEMMIAVLVLIIVIIATSKIFSTTSAVTGLGQATATVLQDAATIERQMREDIARLTTEGFFAIRCVAVRNDVNVAVGGPLLHPNLPEDAIIRADQLVFFTAGSQPMQTLRLSAGMSRPGQGNEARVYYGHAFQLREGRPVDDLGGGVWAAHDPAHIIDDLSHPRSVFFPWHWGDATMVRTQFLNGDALGTNNHQYGAAGNPAIISGRQPEVRQWILARQAVALVNDDTSTPAGGHPFAANSKTSYLTTTPTARSIFLSPGPGGGFGAFGYAREIRNGRMDGAATRLNDIRRWVTYRADPSTGSVLLNPSPGERRPWSGDPDTADSQRKVISTALFYPRAERHAPSAHRIDQSLTNHVISSACSSFTIDWTYDHGVGRVADALGQPITAPNNDVLHGVQIYQQYVPPPPPGAPQGVSVEQPWFGLRDDSRGVYPFNAWSLPSTPIHPLAVEQFDGPLPWGNVPSTNPVEVYEALFGYNQTQPINPQTGNPWEPPVPGEVVAEAYTPFPSAIRVTMVLHDPQTRLEGGREFQFVIKLPRRVN